ncbi:hypothetical protein QVD17_09689 [Tagetes erecta]|uniref:Uncharacterized protein n=1 Tax=Tagetes erecta TaxID=13708 RepID=A0AAD8L1X1_TARER|nr:hypothetical protein QVD17_09689 [Tagetes erecta]
MQTICINCKCLFSINSGHWLQIGEKNRSAPRRRDLTFRQPSPVINTSSSTYIHTKFKLHVSSPEKVVK